MQPRDRPVACAPLPTTVTVVALLALAVCVRRDRLKRGRRYCGPPHWTNCAQTALLAHLSRWLSDEQVVARAGSYRPRARVPIEGVERRRRRCSIFLGSSSGRRGASVMDRRAFIGSVAGGLLTVPLAARAQQMSGR